MPSGVSDYGSATWLSALFGVTALPAAYYVALCQAEPGAAMDGDILATIEPVDPAYARQPYPPGPTAWTANGPYLTNVQAITYSTPTAAWGYLTHFALCTQPSFGQVFAWGGLLNSQFVDPGVGILIPAGALVLGLHSLENTIAA